MNHNEGFKKISDYIFTLTGMNTMFVDGASKTIVDYRYSQIPQLLKPYLKDVYDSLVPYNDYNQSKFIIHKTSYELSFISINMYENNNCLGHYLIGPFLYGNLDTLIIDNILFRHNISIVLKENFIQYYSTIPVITEHKANVICELLAFCIKYSDNLGEFKINVDHQYSEKKYLEIKSKDSLLENFNNHHLAIKNSYQLENEIMHAVETGDLDKVYKIMEKGKMVLKNSAQRIPEDPLRSGKNISLVFNTLLRKSAEKGGLHPVDIHSISEKYAIKIEQSSTIKQLEKIVHDMEYDYCNAIKNNSLKEYSQIIKMAIEYIRKNIDSDLGLDVIASAINISPYELSRKFNKETKNTITNYINILRINEAIHLFENSDLPITEVAFMVGFNDSNYFAKVFKKITGVSPSEYKSSL
jgi:AraC-like DNA-binding protein